MRWAYEVRAPANVDCTQGVPEVTRPIGEWLRLGFVPVRGLQLSRRGEGAAGIAAAARGHLRAGVPDHRELLRDQGVQLLRPVRAVRRSSRRPHDQPAAVRNAMVGLDATAHHGRGIDAAAPDADRALY